jgi:hypothetical protein
MSKENAKPGSAEQQLKGFIAKFEPKHQRAIRALRKALRHRFPTANELVYDNYNFFVIGYCSTERPSDAFVTIAADANRVSLAFYYGATLPDPQNLLMGSGKQNRFLHFESVKALERPEIEALLTAAARQGKAPLPKSGRGKLIIRSVSVKQRPRRKAR